MDQAHPSRCTRDGMVSTADIKSPSLLELVCQGPENTDYKASKWIIRQGVRELNLMKKIKQVCVIVVSRWMG